MAINENTAKHARRILKISTLNASEITVVLNQEVSAVDAYRVDPIERMLRQMPDVEEHDGKYRIKALEDVNQAGARIAQEASKR